MKFQREKRRKAEEAQTRLRTHGLSTSSQYGSGMHSCCNGEKISISIEARLPEQCARQRRNV